MTDLIEADSAHHCQSWWCAALSSSPALFCLSLFLIFFNSFSLPSLPPELWCQAGQALMGRRRVVFIIMPLFIHVSAASDSRACAQLSSLSASLEIWLIFISLFLSANIILSSLLCQVLLSVSFKTDMWTHNTHQSHPVAYVSTQRVLVNFRWRNRLMQAACAGQIASWPLLGARLWLFQFGL